MDSNAMIQSQNNNQALEYVKLIIKAARETHSMHSVAMNKSRDLRKAQQSSDRTEKIRVLQRFIIKYMQFIKSTTQITGLSVYYISIDDISKINIDDQLSIMEGIVFLYEALHSATNFTFKMCLKKLMKQSGIFTETQLDIIEAAMDMSKHDRWIRQI